MLAGVKDVATVIVMILLRLIDAHHHYIERAPAMLIGLPNQSNGPMLSNNTTTARDNKNASQRQRPTAIIILLRLIDAHRHYIKCARARNANRPT